MSDEATGTQLETIDKAGNPPKSRLSDAGKAYEIWGQPARRRTAGRALTGRGSMLLTITTNHFPTLSSRLMARTTG